MEFSLAAEERKIVDDFLLYLISTRQRLKWVAWLIKTVLMNLLLAEKKIHWLRNVWFENSYHILHKS